MTNAAPTILEKNTPLMEQYYSIKAQYQDTLVLFQVGDFYELFFEDAKIASSFLAITLTKRGKNKGEDVPLCGIPVHALNHYLNKLIKGGFRVAICDQLTKPSPGTVVERGITNVFTPGTLTEDSLLDQRSASYLLAFFPGHDQCAMIFSELLTAQLFATTLPTQEPRMIETELTRFFPDEIILPFDRSATSWNTFFKHQGYYTAQVPITGYEQKQEDTKHDIIGQPLAKLWVEQQFSSATLQKIMSQPALENSLTLLYWYLKKNQNKALEQFKTIQFYTPEDYLILDPATQRNLELVKNNQDSSTKNTLLAVIDKAKTAMGSRTIKKWVLRPLVQKSAIIQRQEIVAALYGQVDIMHKLDHHLESIADIERIIGRIALNRATLHDYLALKNSLSIIPDIKKIIYPLTTYLLGNTLYEKMVDLSILIQLLEASLHDEPGGVKIIKQGFDQELDHLRNLLSNGHQAILELENKEIAATGITSLKVSFTAIAGYYIEVTNPNLSKVPDYYIHQQTLVNRKRFVTPELKKLEADLFKAQNEIESVETATYEKVKQEVLTYLPQLRHLAQALAHLDSLFSFAWTAYLNQYVRPEFNEQQNITIINGRHPVVEQSLGPAFIPNDTALTEQESLWIVTGPNMGGKSTYLRQVAHLCIMAQIGTFIPATSANLPILDRIFTRIGASDNVAEGKSTFLLEMEETATICMQATSNSLVILDEVGRGTSTFDGMALAQAIVEYLATKIKARCLFATHYHELTLLSTNITTIANYHTACKKTDDAIIFLHKIIKGSAAGSFGIEVAKLAQLPPAIIKRATQLLATLENPMMHNAYLTGQKNLFEPAQKRSSDPDENKILKQKIILLEQEIKKYMPLHETMKHINFDQMSPKAAFDLLWKLKEKLNITE